MSTELRELQISAFRGLRDLRLEDLGRVNLLVGGNNSGKTSILEAIMLFARPAEARAWMDSSAGRETRISSKILAASLRWLFPVSRQASEDTDVRPVGHLVISGAGRFPMRQLRASYSGLLVLPEPEGKLDLEAMSTIDEALRRVDTVDLHLEWERSAGELATADGELSFGAEGFRRTEALREAPALPVEMISPHIHRTSFAPVRAVSAAVTGSYKPQVVELLQSIDPDITDIDIVQDGPLNPQIFLQHYRTGPTPLSVFGDGVRRAVVLAALIPRAKDGVLLIDELESALHVSVLKPVLTMLRRAVNDFGVQVFATTHSLEAVDAFLNTAESLENETPGSQEDVVLYQLDLEEGERRVKRFGADQLGRLRFERGLDIR
jgi:ABC-type Mn2+/Zn2+ transport system ATPase subunit